MDPSLMESKLFMLTQSKDFCTLNFYIVNLHRRGDKDSKWKICLFFFSLGTGHDPIQRRAEEHLKTNSRQHCALSPTSALCSSLPGKNVFSAGIDGDFA